jgi:hypothetical protein
LLVQDTVWRTHHEGKKFHTLIFCFKEIKTQININNFLYFYENNKDLKFIKNLSLLIYKYNKCILIISVDSSSKMFLFLSQFSKIFFYDLKYEFRVYNKIYMLLLRVKLEWALI